MDRVLLRRQSLGEPSWRTTYLVDQLVEVDEIGSGPLQSSTRSGGKCNTGIYIYYVISQSVFMTHLKSGAVRIELQVHPFIRFISESSCRTSPLLQILPPQLACPVVVVNPAASITHFARVNPGAWRPSQNR